jgi:hypothetical protein
MASYAADIKPLFRPIDIEHMSDYGVDLSTYDGTKASADDILRRLKDPKRPMPPKADGGPWTADRIALFERWIQEGFPP